ncbi:MAG: Ig-like domain-containing protein, partial [Dysgonamonadaceae bacterium]|nr:Ig-like domain-containing protein [Dysgonamonadaceae bacterium]
MNTNSPTIRGVNVPSTTVDVYFDGQKVGTTTTDEFGIWTWPLSGIDEGSYEFYAVAVQQLIVDMTPPNPPTVDEPDKPIRPDGCISGTGEPKATAIIYVDGVKHGTTIVGEDGKWQYCFDPELSEGIHEICVEQTDLAGNTSTKTCINKEIDDTAPAPPGIDELPEPFYSNSCITGTGEPEATITMYVDGVKHGTTTVGEDGKWEYCFIQELSEGQHEICADQTDLAGNTSGKTCEEVNVIKDKTPPVPPKIDNPDAPIRPDGCISGTGEPRATATIYVDGVKHGTTIVGEDGKWQYCFVDPELSEGIHEICVDLTDLAGNTSLKTCVNKEVDDTAPSPPNFTVPSQVPPHFCISGTGEKGAKITLYVDGEQYGYTFVDQSGYWGYCFDLEEGYHSICAEQTDLVGHTSAEKKCSGTLVKDPGILVSIIEEEADNCGGNMYVLGSKIKLKADIQSTSEVKKIIWTFRSSVIAQDVEECEFEITGGGYVEVSVTNANGGTASANKQYAEVYNPSATISFNNDNAIMMARGIYVGDIIYFNPILSGVIGVGVPFANRVEIRVTGPGSGFDYTSMYYTAKTPGNHTATAKLNWYCYNLEATENFEVKSLPADVQPINPTCRNNDASVVSGTATPNSPVVISWDNTYTTTSTDGNGNWSIDLSSMGMTADDLDAHNVVMHNIVNTFQLTSGHVKGLVPCDDGGDDGGTGLSSVRPPEITIVPNPVSNTFHVNGLEVNPSNVEVISLTGATMVKTSNTSEIDATKLAKGTYIVKVT